MLSGIRYRLWVCNTRILDHMPVILQVDNEFRKVSYPFKFNSVWLEDTYFVDLVRTKWNGLLGTEILSPMDALSKKLKKLKILVEIWERKKKRETKDDLVNLERDLDILYTSHPWGFEKEDETLLVMEKERRKLVIMNQEEET